MRRPQGEPSEFRNELSCFLSWIDYLAFPLGQHRLTAAYPKNIVLHYWDTMMSNWQLVANTKTSRRRPGSFHNRFHSLRMASKPSSYSSHMTVCTTSLSDINTTSINQTLFGSILHYLMNSFDIHMGVCADCLIQISPPLFKKIFSNDSEPGRPSQSTAGTHHVFQLWQRHIFNRLDLIRVGLQTDRCLDEQDVVHLPVMCSKIQSHCGGKGISTSFLHCCRSK